MSQFVIFLRGINVGGNKKVPMIDLKKALEKAKFKNVKTLLNSGNVILDSSDNNPVAVKKLIEKVIENTFGFSSSVIVRTAEQIEKLIKSDPFKSIQVTKDTRLYITFLPQKPKSKLKIPYTSPEKNYKILKATDTEIISVLTLIPNSGTIEAMGILEKEFGKNITTRNWNTVVKMKNYILT